MSRRELTKLNSKYMGDTGKDPLPESSYKCIQNVLFDKTSGLLTAKDVSRLLGVAEKSVYRWAKEYRIPCVTIGRCVRFKPEDIEAIRSGMRGLS